MKLKAVHAIYRAENKKQTRVDPGAEFSCPDAEAEDYLASGAAVKIADEPAKPRRGKKKPTETAAAETAPLGEDLLE